MAAIMRTQLPLSYFNTFTWTTGIARRSRSGGATKPIWTQKAHRPNHAFDCEMMQMLFAVQYQVLELGEQFRMKLGEPQ